MGIISAITAFLKVIAGALGLVDKGMDRKAGVDAQRALELEQTLKKQQEVGDAVAKLDTPGRASRDDDPKSWLRSRPGNP